MRPKYLIIGACEIGEADLVCNSDITLATSTRLIMRTSVLIAYWRSTEQDTHGTPTHNIASNLGATGCTMGWLDVLKIGLDAYGRLKRKCMQIDVENEETKIKRIDGTLYLAQRIPTLIRDHLWVHSFAVDIDTRFKKKLTRTVFHSKRWRVLIIRASRILLLNFYPWKWLPNT